MDHASLALPRFLLLWVPMMAAMMVPSTAPTAILWTRTIGSSTMVRTSRMGAFLGGYLVAWAGFGIAAWLLVIVGRHLVGLSPRAGMWMGVVLFAGAGLYQLSELKQSCLRKCRSPFGRVVLFSGWSGTTRDLRAGLHEGGLCVACCWGLMVVMVALGTMNVAVMVGLGVITALEKLWRHGPRLAKVVGAVFLALALVAIFRPEVVPGLQPPAMPAGHHMDHMGMTHHERGG